jgi:hypothetical protein
VLWKVQTAGGSDRFVQLVPAKDKLLGVRRGVLYAFDAASGEAKWRFPEKGVIDDLRRWSRKNFVLGVFGDRVITQLPGNLGGGVLEVRLSDGRRLRALDLKADLGFPDPGFPRAHGMHATLVGAQIAFVRHSEDHKRCQVCVFDLAEWREIARFELPPIRGHIDVLKGRGYGFLKREDESFTRAFTADLRAGVLYSLPVGDRTSYPDYVLLPDGSRLTPDGRLGPECAYEGHWPWGVMASVHGDGERVFVLDRFGLARVGPRDGREIWRVSLSPRIMMFDAAPAAGADVLALAERNYLFVVDAERGTLRAAIRVLPGFKSMVERKQYMFRNPVRVACDGPRVYFAATTGLTAYSTHPVDPDAPDPDDPGDPAYSIARCRKTASEGDWEGALKAIQGVSASVQLRPRVRGELAGLLSQLSRSPAATACPGLWMNVMLSDGWACGELFLNDYERLLADPGIAKRVQPSLFAMGGEKALGLLVGMLDGPRKYWCGSYTVRAAEKLTGESVVERMLSMERLYDVEFALAPPMDEDTFKQLLPKLRGKSKSWLERFARHIPPERQLMLLEGKTDDKTFARLAEVARHQVDSRARGKGETGKIDIVTRDGAGAGPPHEGF